MVIWIYSSRDLTAKLQKGGGCPKLLIPNGWCKCHGTARTSIPGVLPHPKQRDFALVYDEVSSVVPVIGRR